MILVCCVDNQMGMTFNHRRQSQDRVLRQRVLERAGGKLWMNEFSAKQFTEALEIIHIDEHCLEKCPNDAYCFVENLPVRDLEPEQILLYRWNRTYPADTYFDLPLEGWTLCGTADFSGSSHERITEEVYIR